MKRPRYSDCMDENDEFDQECYDEAMSDYEDEQRDLEIERRWEEGDRLHDQRRDEKMLEELEK